MFLRLSMVLLISLVTACGFQLRGSQFSNFSVSSIHLDNQGASNLTEQVRLQLEGAGVTITSMPNEADYVITLKQERFERSVLSVSAATGKVEEYLVTYSAGMDARDQNGETLTSNDKIAMSRDYAFDEGAVLGKFSEETVIREDLVYRAASQVLRRMQALIAGKQSR